MTTWIFFAGLQKFTKGIPICAAEEDYGHPDTMHKEHQPIAIDHALIVETIVTVMLLTSITEGEDHNDPDIIYAD